MHGPRKRAELRRGRVPALTGEPVPAIRLLRALRCDLEVVGRPARLAVVSPDAIGPATAEGRP